MQYSFVKKKKKKYYLQLIETRETRSRFQKRGERSKVLDRDGEGRGEARNGQHRPVCTRRRINQSISRAGGPEIVVPVRPRPNTAPVERGLGNQQVPTDHHLQGERALPCLMSAAQGTRESRWPVCEGISPRPCLYLYLIGDKLGPRENSTLLLPVKRSNEIVPRFFSTILMNSIDFERFNCILCLRYLFHDCMQ